MQRSGQVCQLSELFLVHRDSVNVHVLEELLAVCVLIAKRQRTDIAYRRLRTLEKFVVKHSAFAPGGD